MTRVLERLVSDGNLRLECTVVQCADYLTAKDRKALVNTFCVNSSIQKKQVSPSGIPYKVMVLSQTIVYMPFTKQYTSCSNRKSFKVSQNKMQVSQGTNSWYKIPTDTIRSHGVEDQEVQLCCQAQPWLAVPPVSRPGHWPCPVRRLPPNLLLRVHRKERRQDLPQLLCPLPKVLSRCSK